MEFIAENWEKIAFLLSLVASLATAFTIWRKDHELAVKQQAERDEAILAAVTALTDMARGAASDHSAEHHTLMAIARDIQGALQQLANTLDRLQTATGHEHRDIEKELARQSANVESLLRKGAQA